MEDGYDLGERIVAQARRAQWSNQAKFFDHGGIFHAVSEYEADMFPRVEKEAARTKKSMELFFVEGAAKILAGLVKDRTVAMSQRLK